MLMCIILTIIITTIEFYFVSFLTPVGNSDMFTNTPLHIMLYIMKRYVS